MSVAAAEPARHSSVSEERARTCYHQRADTDNKSPTYGQLTVVSPPDSNARDVGTSAQAKQAAVKSVSMRAPAFNSSSIQEMQKQQSPNPALQNSSGQFRVPSCCCTFRNATIPTALYVITWKSQTTLTFKMSLSSLCVQHRADLPLLQHVTSKLAFFFDEPPPTEALLYGRSLCQMFLRQCRRRLHRKHPLWRRHACVLL